MSNVALTRDQVRRVDEAAVQEFGMSGLVLMENAGRGCAEHISAIIHCDIAGEDAGGKEGTDGKDVSVTILWEASQ